MKTHHTLSWILQVLVVLILVYPSWSKLIGTPEEVALFTTLGMEPTGRYLIGFFEALAIVLLLIPSSVTWGALLTLCIMSIFLGVTFLSALGILILRSQELPFLRDAFARSTTPDKNDGPTSK